ncbi:MAG: hypothetical protein M1838_003508 [Thelocarpon superellum]|nr:MAG: hypothetical protein M1838_003508 [Thelocarpon superellum]
MATTPPMASSIRTPPTPHHGAKHDNYQPYPTRKSTRSQRALHATPPPPDSLHDANTSSLTPPTSKHATSSRPAHSHSACSPPPTVHTSPKKKHRSLPKGYAASRRTVSGRLTEDSTAFAAAALGISPVDSHTAPSISVEDTSAQDSIPGMLPTPAKTPQKRRAQPASAVKSTARILFPARPDTVEEAMPSPKKRRATKHHELSFDGLMGGDGQAEQDIAIFTDSKDRVPEVDPSMDNPFNDSHTTPVKRKSKRQANANSKDEVEQPINHDEGMVYVFRGKKIYRKFNEEKDLDHGRLEVDEQDRGLNLSSARPMTRSSIKPRLLFPTKRQQEMRLDDCSDLEVEATHEDEEAITDIDDAAVLPLPASRDVDASEAAPQASSPLAPPEALDPTSPISPVDIPHPLSSSSGSGARKGKTATFDGWPRIKPAIPNGGVANGTKGKKRHATTGSAVTARNGGGQAAEGTHTDGDEDELAREMEGAGPRKRTRSAR